MEILKGIENECIFETGKFYVVLGEENKRKEFISNIISFEKMKEKYIYNNVDLHKIKSDEFYRQYISIVFSDDNLLPYLNSISNIEVALNINKKKIDDELLKKLNISLDKRKISQLTQEEKYKISLIRSISNEASLIVVNDFKELEIMNVLKEIANKSDKCVLCSTQSNLIASNADAVVKLLDDGIEMYSLEWKKQAG